MNDYSMLKDLVTKVIESNNSLAITLIILVSINIGIELFRFGTMLILSEKDKKNKRQLLLEERRVKIAEHLFQSLDSLTLLDKSQEESLLLKLKGISQYITHNKIFISKPCQKIAIDILDYFKDVLTDYRQKSIEKETKLFDNFCNDFNK